MRDRIGAAPNAAAVVMAGGAADDSAEPNDLSVEETAVGPATTEPEVESAASTLTTSEICIDQLSDVTSPTAARRSVGRVDLWSVETGDTAAGEPAAVLTDLGEIEGPRWIHDVVRLEQQGDKK